MSTPAEQVLKRRTFLGAAAGDAAAIAAPAFIRPDGRSAGPTPGDWAGLARDLSGPLVRPGEARYTVARRLFDPRFDSISPAGIACWQIARDVVTCLAFARKFRLPLAARCGGHSYAGYSTTAGLVIDVSRIRGMTVSGSTATVAAGTRLMDFCNTLAAHRRAVPGGSCPAVGISGLTLGGGIGVVGRHRRRGEPARPAVPQGRLAPDRVLPEPVLLHGRDAP